MFGFNDLFSFDRLLTPVVIKLVYNIGLVLIAIVGIIAAVSALFIPYGGGLGTALLTLLGTAASLVGWRISVELTIVFFGIFDRLGEIRDRLRASEGA